MSNITAKEMADLLAAEQNIVFLTGAGASVPSGIPDYRSVEGLYTASGVKEPEYLLSRRALLNDTADFHRFIAQLYQDVEPNVIHKAMAKLEKEKNVTIITQNIDGLHTKAGSEDVVEFHGTLATCYCEKCNQDVTIEAFLESWEHEGCGGLVRPNVVLYDEGIDQGNISHSLKALEAADVVAIVGTTFKVYPFASLISYAKRGAKIVVINRDPVQTVNADAVFLGDAVAVFELLV